MNIVKISVEPQPRSARVVRISAHAYLSVQRDDKLCRVNTAEGVM